MKMQPLPFLLLLLSIFLHSRAVAQWESIGSGIDSTQRFYYSLSVVDENNIWAVPVSTTFTPNYEYTRTTNGGDTWEAGILSDTIGSYYPFQVFALDEDNVWILMVSIPIINQTRLFRTRNGGMTWEEQSGDFNMPAQGITALHFFNENEGLGFGGTSMQGSLAVFKTDDGGDNWERIPSGMLPDPVSEELIRIFSGNSSYEAVGDTLWFVTSASRVFRTTDKGETWAAFDAGISGEGSFPGLASIAFENASNGIVTTFQSPGQAAKTTDGGATWAPISIPASPSLGAIEYVPGTTNTYIINDGFQQFDVMLITPDGGDNWLSMAYPPSVACMQFISPTIGFGGGNVDVMNGAGLYKWTGDLATVTDTENITSLNIDSDLIKLSPNPVRDILNLEIDASFQGKPFLIKLYSANGQSVYSKELSNATSLEINTNIFQSGIYLLSIHTGEKVISKKFVKE